MPLHRNEVSSNKTMNFSGQSQSVFVKENHKLSRRERTTVMTSISSSKTVKPLQLEFVFKGKGKRVKLNPPKRVSVQWAEKGSYRLDNMVKFIDLLPNVPAVLFPKLHQIYILDDYSVHLDPSLEENLHKKGYFLIIIGGGIAGDVQGNDTNYHNPSKKHYRDAEMKLMIEILNKDKSKIPAPSRDDMMRMFSDAWGKTCEEVDGERVFKQNMLTIKFDGSEDHLASRRLWDLVGTEMVEFRANLLNSTPKRSIKELRKCMIPPKGVKRKALKDNELPDDEGIELYDGDILESNEDNESAGESDEGREDDGNSENDGRSNDGGSQENEIGRSDENEVSEMDQEGLKDIKFLDEIAGMLSNENCTKELLPYIVKMETLVKTARRKSLKAGEVNQLVKKKIGELAVDHRDTEAADKNVNEPGPSKHVTVELSDNDDENRYIQDMASEVQCDSQMKEAMDENGVRSDPGDSSDDEERGNELPYENESSTNEQSMAVSSDDEELGSFKNMVSEFYSDSRTSDDDSDKEDKEDGNVFDLFQ